MPLLFVQSLSTVLALSGSELIGWVYDLRFLGLATSYPAFRKLSSLLLREEGLCFWPQGWPVSWKGDQKEETFVTLCLGEKRPRAVPSVTKRTRPSKGPRCFGVAKLENKKILPQPKQREGKRHPVASHHDWGLHSYEQHAVQSPGCHFLIKPVMTFRP